MKSVSKSQQSLFGKSRREIQEFQPLSTKAPNSQQIETSKRRQIELIPFCSCNLIPKQTYVAHNETALWKLGMKRRELRHNQVHSQKNV